MRWSVLLGLVAAPIACSGRNPPPETGGESPGGGCEIPGDCAALLDECPDRQGTATCLRPWTSEGEHLLGICQVSCDPIEGPPADADEPSIAATVPSWRENEQPLVGAASLDAPGEPPIDEISLLPFEFDPRPVEAWRYDRCVDAGACEARSIPQPGGDPDDPAVGMTWEAANGYCLTRGMGAQSAPQDFCIRSTLGDDAYGGSFLLSPDTPPGTVSRGFRCVRVSE